MIWLIVLIVIEFILVIYNVIKRFELERYILYTEKFIEEVVKENTTLKKINLRILDIKETENDL